MDAVQGRATTLPALEGRAMPYGAILQSYIAVGIRAAAPAYPGHFQSRHHLMDRLDAHQAQNFDYLKHIGLS